MRKCLTPKQNSFCQFVAGGASYHEAYKRAYATTAKLSTTLKGAHQVSKHPLVRARIAELRSEVAAVNGWSREIWVAEMTDEVRASAKGSRHRLDSLVELGKALGYYDPVKVSVEASARSLVIVVQPPGADEIAEAIDVQSLPAAPAEEVTDGAV